MHYLSLGLGSEYPAGLRPRGPLLCVQAPLTRQLLLVQAPILASARIGQRRNLWVWYKTGLPLALIELEPIRLGCGVIQLACFALGVRMTFELICVLSARHLCKPFLTA